MSEARARIFALHYSPRRREAMRSVQSIMAVRDHGLAGDAHARPGGERQVLFIDVETLRLLDISPGSLKENITTEALLLNELKSGDLIHSGEARFEVTMDCEPCAHVDEIRPGLREEISGRRGFLAKVIRSGELKVGQALMVHKVEGNVLMHPIG